MMHYVWLPMNVVIAMISSYVIMFCSITSYDDRLTYDDLLSLLSHMISSIHTLRGSSIIFTVHILMGSSVPNHSKAKCMLNLLRAMYMLSSTTKKGEIESAVMPLIEFWC